MLKHRLARFLIIGIVALILFSVSLGLIYRPSHDRSWELGHEALPQLVFAADNNNVTISNYRNFAWTGDFEALPNYETRTIDTNKIEGVDVLISHFDDFEGMAHIFLSFRVEGEEPVVVSLETRREDDESFSPLLGILRQFEIIYVVGSERDLVGVRTDHRDERVYLYPTVATSMQAETLFRRLATDINGVYDQPRMYNTLLRNCTNEITRQVEAMSELDFPFTWKTVLPGYFDEVLYEMELIDTSRPFIETKANHLIDNTKVDTKNESYSEDLRSLLK